MATEFEYRQMTSAQLIDERGKLQTKIKGGSRAGKRNVEMARMVSSLREQASVLEAEIRRRGLDVFPA